MNPMEKTMRRVDAAQQRFGPAALVFGVVKKFGDDNAGNLVTNLAYSAFLCVFPLLLILITVLNIVLVNYPSVRHSLLNSTLGEFPVVGTTLESNIHGLHRSSTHRTGHRSARSALGINGVGPVRPVLHVPDLEFARSRAPELRLAVGPQLRAFSPFWG